MHEYYKNSFPAEEVWKFMTARCKQPEHKEFAYEFDIGSALAWKRYNACASSEDLRKIVTKKDFHALHIGPSFSESSRYARSPTAHITGKELVFDLDLQDIAWFEINKSDQLYNDRYVKAVFSSCAVLIEILKEVMDFKHFMPVYSGRRGVHLWVLDERAYDWGSSERDALCSFVSGIPSRADPRVIQTKHLKNNPSFGHKVWEAVKRAKVVLLTPQRQNGVGLLDSQSDVNSFIIKLFDVHTDDCPVQKGHAASRRHFESLAKLMANLKTDFAAFGAIEKAVEGHCIYKERLSDIMISLAWPVVDIQATAKVNHCTKSIFSLHAATNRIAVPLHADHLYSTTEIRLPPVVNPEELHIRGSASARQFSNGIQLLKSALKALTVAKKSSTSTSAPAAAMTDIEDIVPCTSLHKRQKSIPGGPFLETLDKTLHAQRSRGITYDTLGRDSNSKSSI